MTISTDAWQAKTSIKHVWAKITLSTTPSVIRYFSDKTSPTLVISSLPYEARITAGTKFSFERGTPLAGGFLPSSVSLVLNNEDGGLDNDFQEYELFGNAVEVGIMINYSGSEETETLFKGTIKGEPRWSRGTVQIEVEDAISKLQGLVGNVTYKFTKSNSYIFSSYPWNWNYCNPKYVDRMMPTIYGHQLECPIVRINHAGILESDITSSATSLTFTLAQGSNFAYLQMYGDVDNGHVIQIDEELMKIVAVQSSTKSVTVTRSCYNSEAKPHKANTPIYIVGSNSATNENALTFVAAWHGLTWPLNNSPEKLLILHNGEPTSKYIKNTTYGMTQVQHDLYSTYGYNFYMGITFGNEILLPADCDSTVQGIIGRKLDSTPFTTMMGVGYIIEDILKNCIGILAADIDSTSFHATTGNEITLWVGPETDLISTIETLLRGAMARIYCGADGKFYYSEFAPDNSADYTIEEYQLFDGNPLDVWWSYDHLADRVLLKYKPNFKGGSPADHMIIEKTQSTVRSAPTLDIETYYWDSAAATTQAERFRKICNYGIEHVRLTGPLDLERIPAGASVDINCNRPTGTTTGGGITYNERVFKNKVWQVDRKTISCDESGWYVELELNDLHKHYTGWT